MNLQSDRLTGRPHGCDIWFGIWAVWVDQEDNARGCGRNLMQQLQTLAAERAGVRCHSGGITLRTVEAGDETRLDRIVDGREHDGDRCRRTLRDENCSLAARRENDIDFAADQINRHAGKALGVQVRKAIFDRYILTLDEACCGKTIVERVINGRV